jgi:membrane-associated phospholipid phosphatase
MATLSACSLLKTSRLISVLSIATWLLICASTVLLKKHYVLDVAAGVLLGAAIHFLLVEPVLKKEGIKWRL